MRFCWDLFDRLFAAVSFASVSYARGTKFPKIWAAQTVLLSKRVRLYKNHFLFSYKNIIPRWSTEIIQNSII